jgi:hypothetical protein
MHLHELLNTSIFKNSSPASTIFFIVLNLVTALENAMEILAALALFVFTPVYLLAVGIKLWGFSVILYRWNFPLSRVPGPKLASWTRFWWLKLVSRSKLEQEMTSLHREYGMQLFRTADVIIRSSLESQDELCALLLIAF